MPRLAVQQLHFYELNPTNIVAIEDALAQGVLEYYPVAGFELDAIRRFAESYSASGAVALEVNGDYKLISKLVYHVDSKESQYLMMIFNAKIATWDDKTNYIVPLNFNGTIIHLHIEHAFCNHILWDGEETDAVERSIKAQRFWSYKDDDDDSDDYDDDFFHYIYD